MGLLKMAEAGRYGVGGLASIEALESGMSSMNTCELVYMVRLGSDIVYDNASRMYVIPGEAVSSSLDTEDWREVRGVGGRVLSSGIVGCPRGISGRAGESGGEGREASEGVSVRVDTEVERVCIVEGRFDVRRLREGESVGRADGGEVESGE